MALSPNTVWEFQIGGSSNNGGGFRGNPEQLPPSTPSVATAGTGGTVVANTYYVVITYTSGSNVETPISGQATITTTGATSTITVTNPTDPGNSSAWNVYVGTVNGGPYFPQGTTLAFGTNRVITSTPPTTGIQPAGTDRSQTTTPFVAVDNSTITASTTGANSNVITFTGYTPTGLDVGNLYHAIGGTNITAGFYEIIAITATTWTVTGAANLTTAGGAGTALIGNMGGALSHPSTIATVATNNNIAFAKYSATAYLFGVSLTFSQSGFTLIGYDTHRTIDNTDANRPIFRAGANSLTLFNCNATHRFSNLDFDNPGGSFTGLVALQIGGSGVARNCRFSNYQSWALQLGTGSAAIDCEFISCGSANITLYMNGPSIAIRCLFRSCTSTGQGVVYSTTGGSAVIDCVAYATTGGSTSFFTPAMVYYQGCVAYGGLGNSNANGFSAGNGGAVYDGCIAYGNQGWGFTCTSANRYTRYIRCSTGANGQGGINPVSAMPDQQIDCAILAGDPFTAPASFDFSTNGTASGLALRSKVVAFPVGTTSYPDAGAAQHSDASVVSGPTYTSY